MYVWSGEKAGQPLLNQMRHLWNGYVYWRNDQVFWVLVEGTRVYSYASKSERTFLFEQLPEYLCGDLHPLLTWKTVQMKFEEYRVCFGLMVVVKGQCSHVDHLIFCSLDDQEGASWAKQGLRLCVQGECMGWVEADVADQCKL